jgi:hypothetical protein
MAWTRYTHASVSADTPRALGTCDRCGFVYNRDRLAWQLDWRGPRMQNLRILVCPTCMDAPQQNGQRVIILPPDPVPIMNPRPDPHMFMGQSSSPDTTQTGAPTVIATEGSDPLVTETSSQNITWEQQTTPTPTSSGYIAP